MATGRANHRRIEQWLLIEWPAGAAKPTKYWLATGPRRLSLVQLVRWAKARWRVEQEHLQLKDDLGVDHFEGRRWLGWHHHVTMATMAYGFLIREQLRHRADWTEWAEVPSGDVAPSPVAASAQPDIDLCQRAHLYTFIRTTLPSLGTWSEGLISSKLPAAAP
jgi:hypothetical protein